MKFSIVVPCYKVEKYLPECVDSILNQTFRDFELILVDDGSPDGVPAICDEYEKKDPHIHVIHQPNSGIACARNTGIAASKGEYVICIDSDDCLISNDVMAKLEEMTHRHADVIMFGYKKFFESDGSWGDDICANIGDANSVGEIVKTMLINGSYIATAWTKAIRRNLLVENNITFRPGMVSGEDVDWFLNVLCHTHKMESLPKACLAYRQRPDSISHSPKVQSLNDFIWILETWPRRINANVSDKELQDTMMKAMAYYLANTMILYSSYSNDIARQFKARMKNLMHLFDYAVSSRALTMKKIYNIVGFDMSINLLKIMSKLKKRQ